MDSKMVQRGAAALLAALVLAALAWGVRVLVEAVLIVRSLLGDTGMSSGYALIVSTVVVAVLAGIGYFLINKRLRAEEAPTEE